MDWTDFKQGPVSDLMWIGFQQVVRLCRDFVRWEKVVRQEHFQPSVKPPYSRYMRGKRQTDGNPKMEDAKEHMSQAARDVARAMANVASLLGPEDENTPDGKLCAALTLAIRPSVESERAQYVVCAFTSFDAEQELQGAPDEIADRWIARSTDPGPNFHPAMGRVPASFEPIGLGEATGRGAEPPV